MSGRRSILALLALCALLFGVVPASASASMSASELLTGVSQLNGELALMGQGTGEAGLPSNRALSELRFKNRDGYKFAVVAFGQTVALSVSRTRVHPRSAGAGKRKQRDRSATTTYFAHGDVTPTSISASFGDRGHIDVHFEPTGRDLHATHKAGCKRSGRSVLAKFGFFVGDLRFEGEGDYTSANVHRISGRSVDLSALLACLFGGHPGAHATFPSTGAPLGLRLPAVIGDSTGAPSTPAVPTHPSPGPKPTSLLVDSKAALARTVFAAEARGKGRVRFLAVDEESEGSIGVVRLAYARGKPSSLTADRALSSADVSPPPPFEGTGSLRHGTGNDKSWSGSLAVSFLGAPHVPLTGAQFNAWLSRGF